MNGIGEDEQEWTDVQTILGWLDLSNGSSDYTSYNAKTVDASHIFLCDYEPLNFREDNSRMIDDCGQIYDVKYIDDPMGMHQHYEIYLRQVGDTRCQ